MTILRATLDGLAKFLGAESHQAEVVYSETSARAAFSRRGLFRAAGAVAAGTLFADVVPADASYGYEFRLTSYPQLVCRQPGTTLVSFDEMLKKHFSWDVAQRLVFPESPLLTMISFRVPSGEEPEVTL